jgi:hypothetical protein
MAYQDYNSPGFSGGLSYETPVPAQPYNQHWQPHAHHAPPRQQSFVQSASSQWSGQVQQPPSINWDEVVTAEPEMLPEQAQYRAYRLGPFPHGGLKVLHAATLQAAEAAMEEVTRDAYQSGRLIGLDLEWNPDFNKGQFSPVALVQVSPNPIILLAGWVRRLAQCAQVSSGNQVALLHVCRFNHQLPQRLLQLLGDPTMRVAVCGWGLSDAGKMSRTFGLSPGAGLNCQLIDLHLVRDAASRSAFGSLHMLS